jgi:hypothetical protein
MEQGCPPSEALLQWQPHLRPTWWRRRRWAAAPPPPGARGAAPPGTHPAAPRRSAPRRPERRHLHRGRHGPLCAGNRESQRECNGGQRDRLRGRTRHERRQRVGAAEAVEVPEHEAAAALLACRADGVYRRRQSVGTGGVSGPGPTPPRRFRATFSSTHSAAALQPVCRLAGRTRRLPRHTKVVHRVVPKDGGKLQHHLQGQNVVDREVVGQGQ